MPNYIVDPNTGIKVPTVGVDPGEDYAVNVSDALTKLSALTHTGASNLDGIQIPTQGLNINEDLSFQSNNATNFRSTRYVDQPASLVGVGDIDCVYFENGDLWINDGTGTPIQITSGGLVNSTTTNNYNVLDISANRTINPTDSDIVFSADSTANNIIVTLPLASDVPKGRFYFVKDRLGTSETHAITINPNGSDTIDGLATYVIHDNYAVVCLVRDSSSNWLLFAFDKKVYDTVANIKFNAASSVTFEDTGLLQFNNTGNIDFAGAGAIDFEVAGQINFNTSPGFITMNGGGQIDVSGGPAAIILGADGVINNPGISKLTGVVGLGARSVSASATIETDPTSNAKTVILVNTNTNSVTLGLPSVIDATPGMILIIKDVTGNATSKNITVTPKAAELLEGLNASKLILTNWGSLSLISNYPTAQSWSII